MREIRKTKQSGIMKTGRKSYSEFISQMAGWSMARLLMFCVFDITILHRNCPREKKTSGKRSEKGEPAWWPLTNNEINLVNHSFQVCLHYDEL